MAIKVQICALTKHRRTQQGRQHPHNLCPLLINSKGVEIRNLKIGVWLHWMGGWPTIFIKLRSPKITHILDPFDRSTVQIGRKLTVSKHSKAFF